MHPNIFMSGTLRKRSKLLTSYVFFKRNYSNSEGARACGSETEERWPSSVSHSTGARGGETGEAVLHVIGLGWAPVHMGNAQCLVCFKRLQCWKPSLSFLSLSVVSWEMWKWFCPWISLRFFWEGWLLPSPFPFFSNVWFSIYQSVIW